MAGESDREVVVLIFSAWCDRLPQFCISVAGPIFSDWRSGYAPALYYSAAPKRLFSSSRFWLKGHTAPLSLCGEPSLIGLPGELLKGDLPKS